MNIEQLKQIISQGESDHLEFKKSTSLLKPACETLCALLNSNGGSILIGVSNDGKIHGQHISDRTKQELARELAKIEPKASPEINYINVDENKKVILIKASSGSHIPYVYDGRPYERSESTTLRMSQHRYEQLIVQRGQLNHFWEDQIAEGYSIDDLDSDEIKKTIKEGIDHNRIAIEVLNYDIEAILNKLNLINKGHITNAAIVLFGKDMKSRFSHCAIKMARFRGRDKLDGFIDNQWVTGNAFQLIRASNDFISRHLPIAGYFEPGKLQRIDQPAVPALALREAIINSICHRNYKSHSTTITLAIYDDRLELWNAGELPPELKLEDLKKLHSSYLRNKNISTVFYKRGWIESWGTGTLRMINLCYKNNTAEPEFEQNSGGFLIRFQFKEAMKSTAATRDFLQTEHLTARQQEIIDVMQQEKEMSATEILKRMKNKLPIRTLRHELSKLQKISIVKSLGHGRTFVWILERDK